MRQRRALQIILLVALFTAPRWLPAAGLGPEPREPTAAESQAIGWQDPRESADIARDIFERVNAERHARGAPPLVWHEGLARLARAWSLHMLRDGAYGHSPDSYRVHPDFAGTGENILMMYRGAQDAHVAWMESDGHRVNILRAEFDAVGIGVVCRNDGRLWATQIFGVARAREGMRHPVSAGPDPVVADGPGPECPTRRGLFGERVP